MPTSLSLRPRVQETPAPVARAKPLRVVGLTLLWLALANLAAWSWLEFDQTNRGYAIIRAKWRLLRELDAPVDYLVLGDSTCGQGIDPDQLGEELGGNALNLCTVGDMTTIGDAWLLESYVERHGAPAAVVIGHSYDVWARDESRLELAAWNLGVEGAKWESLEPRLLLGWRERLRNRLAPYLPLYFQPETLRQVLSGTRTVRFEVSAKGFVSIRNADPGRVEEDTNRHLDELSTSVIEFSEANRRGLGALLAAGAKHRIPLVFVHGPVHERLRRSPLFEQRLLELDLLLDELLEPNADATLGLRESVGFPASELENSDHLTRDGARRYTSRVAGVVREALERSLSREARRPATSPPVTSPAPTQ